jgi:hypothetical protein
MPCGLPACVRARDSSGNSADYARADTSCAGIPGQARNDSDAISGIGANSPVGHRECNSVFVNARAANFFVLRRKSFPRAPCARKINRESRNRISRYNDADTRSGCLRRGDSGSSPE